MNHRYRLATYRECKAHREWNTTCPDCGRPGKFSPYIDTVTMRPVDDRQCGRCNRLSNCGYHLPPREMPRTEDFISRRAREERENPGPVNCISHANHAKAASQKARSLSASPSDSAVQFASATMRTSRDSRDLRENKSFARNTSCEISETKDHQREAEEFYAKMRRACEQSQPWGSHLVTWLRTLFPREQVAAALKRYRVGGTPDGATLWWQIDHQGRVHTGKAMQYNPLTGHRVKEETPSVLRTSPPLGGEGSAMAAKPLHKGRGWSGSSPVNWAHRMRLYGEPSELVVPQCLFGLHLTPHLSPQGGMTPTAMTDPLPLGGGWEGVLVESEKTALIMSLIKPDRVWLATGGKANLKAAMLAPLIGYDVEVYPDADALHDWYTRTVELNRCLGTRLHIPTWYYNLMDHDEAIAQGLDLADIILADISQTP